MAKGILFFDTETTGLLKPKGTPLALQPRIIELYAVLTTKRNNVISEIDQLIQPGIPLPPEITRITGIDDQDLDGQPPFAAVAGTFKDMLRNAGAVVGHNLTFDMDVVTNDFKRAKLKPPRWPNRRVCTVEQTEHLTGKRLKLGDLYYRLFGEPMGKAHRAKEDVTAMRKCYFRLVKKGEL